MKTVTNRCRQFLVVSAIIIVLITLARHTQSAYAADIIINSNITTNTTWTADNVYVLAADIRVLEGVRLTINPGTVIKPQVNTRLIIEGVLYAQGTSVNPIVFTSYKDDDHGGDTNGDGSTSAPAPNDWGWIEFTDTSVDSENLLEYTTILYGGKDNWSYANHYYGAVRLISASPTISNSTFSYNSNYAIGIDTGSFPTVTGNTFTNNGTNGIGVYGGTITANGTWTSVNYPYVLNSDITVAEGASLTISPGVVVKGLDNTRLIINGVLKAQGSPTERIVFTSIKDDTHGGDTNADGSTSAPAPNDWGWIEFTDPSVDSENLLEYTTILYGGKDNWSYANRYYGAVRLISASPTISNSTFSYNSNYAIGIDTGSFPTVTGNTFTNNGTNGIGVYEGTITANGTWTSVNYPYVLNSDITVAEGASLTISPGVVVKGLDNTRLIINGVLKAQGSPTERIVFTSIKDDTHGGDTNADGSTSAPAPNDWGWIEFTDTSVDSENLLEYTTILYGGKDNWSYANRYYGAVRLISASPTISNSTFSYNSNYAIGIDTGSFPTVTGNTFTNNGTNGIGVYGGTITANGTWTSVNYPYVLNSDITVAEGASLTISPGVVVKGLDNTRLIINGVLKAQGSPTERIVFTSIKDDTHGGDTNADGSTSAPAPNDWGWIEFTDPSVDSENLLEYTTILYGGKDNWSYANRYYGAVRLISASPTIRNNLITRNNQGIWTSGASFPYIVGNAIYRNWGYGFYNEGKPLVVKAENNWWGHESGPYDPSDDPDDPTHLYNPDGLGDKVSDYVDYMPWINSPTTQPYILLDGFAFLPDQAGQIYVTIPIGRSFFLAVPFVCNPTHVQAIIAGTTYPLSDPDGDRIWTTTIPNINVDPQTFSLTVMASGGLCDGSAWEIAQITLIDPSGYVYDAITNGRISGARVTLYYFDAGQNDYFSWNGLQFGQVNPQTTDEQGRYGWDVPAGSYFVTVQKSGFRDYQSSPVTVPPLVTDLNIPLMRIGQLLNLYLPAITQ
jgi:hypothetical protein